MKRFAFAAVVAVAVISLGFNLYTGASDQHHKKISLRTGAGVEALASATVSFGGWMTNPPLDRFKGDSPPSANHHELIPNIATIRAGGYVNFIISGLHVVTVYDDGTQPKDINTALIIPGPRPGPPIINDPNRRIYRGIDPVILGSQVEFLLDRVEVVHFDRPGTYLVICSVLPHFQEGMYGFVTVVGSDPSSTD